MLETNTAYERRFQQCLTPTEKAAKLASLGLLCLLLAGCDPVVSPSEVPTQRGPVRAEKAGLPPVELCAVRADLCEWTPWPGSPKR